MIGRLHHVILDCPDLESSAAFWSEVLGQPITYQSPDFWVVATSDRHSGLAFQLAPDSVPPTWPDPSVPQQIHFDVMVDDVSQAKRRVAQLGARHLGGDVYADPAGHPFCLIPLPPWAS